MTFEELDAEQYHTLWKSGEDHRKAIMKRQRYYSGQHDIVGRNKIGVDGAKKSELVANFIKYGIDMFVGSIVGEPVMVTAIETDEEVENESPSTYREIGTDNDFDTSDVTNTRNAYIAGYGLETYEYTADDDKIIITPQDPAQWHNVFNSDGTHIGSIHVSTIEKGEFYDNELLDHGLTMMIVYTDKNIKVYTKSKSRNNGKWAEDEDKSTDHAFGVVPIVLWVVNEDKASHISGDVIGQQDEYNEIDSSFGDDLRYDSDGILEVKGYNIDQINDIADSLREYKVFPVPIEGGIRFVKKDTDFARVQARLELTRSHIFMGLNVPDIEEIVGATGDTSGIALGLKFKPMQDNAKSMIAHLRSSVRSRIDMINRIKGVIGQSIEDVQVNIDFDLPHNSIEEWQNIGSLTGIVSHVKQLEMLTDVEDPDQELKRLEREAEGKRFIERTEGTPDEIVARNDAAIKEMSVQFAPDVARLIETIEDAVLQKIAQDNKVKLETPETEA